MPYHVVIVTAAFEADSDSHLHSVDASASIYPTDVHFGAPGQSSVRYEADVASEKPKVDVLVNGRAHAPGGRKSERVIVGLKVGSIDKRLVVTGDRVGRSTRPRPFVTMPIVYERAFGGHKENGGDFYGLNPVGVGYRGNRSQQPSIETEHPNVEYEDGRQEPAGYGVISREWRPRLDFAGTYDVEWTKKRWPMLPADFHPAYHQAAPHDQQLDELHGGERVEVLNMTPEGRWEFRVPTLRVPLRLWYANEGGSANLRVDTLIIEPDSYRITLKARAKIPMRRNHPPLRQVIVGHVTPGWWLARVRGKAYLDWREQGGREITASDFEQ